MSLLAIPWEIGSVRAERVGQGEVGWYIHPKGEKSMAVCGFGCINPSVGSLHKIGPRKQSSHLTGPPCSVQVQFTS